MMKVAVVVDPRNNVAESEPLINSMVLLSAEKKTETVFFIPEQETWLEYFRARKLPHDILPDYPDYNECDITSIENKQTLVTSFQKIRELVIDHSCDAILCINLGNLSCLLAALELRLPLILRVEEIRDSSVEPAKTDTSFLYDQTMLEFASLIFTKTDEISGYLQCLLHTKSPISWSNDENQFNALFSAMLEDVNSRFSGYSQMRDTILNLFILSNQSTNSGSSLSDILFDSNEFIEKTRLILHKVNRERNNSIARIYRRFLDRTDLSSQVGLSFQSFLDQNSYALRKRGFRLRAGVNLQQVPFDFYPLETGNKNLTGIQLAIALDVPILKGNIGIEIISPTGAIVASAEVAGEYLQENYPVQFDFIPDPGSNRPGYWLRVYVRNVDAPVRLLEWQKYSLYGFGKFLHKPFCNLIFKKDLKV